MRREILIESSGGETRVALLEDDQLSEAYIERPGSRRLTGDIYKGRVSNVLPGIQSAFVDVGLERDTFLYVEDLLGRAENPGEETTDESTPPASPRTHSPRASIEDLLHVGQDLIVQVVRDPIAEKGARITTQTALAGRFLVLLPSVEHVGISRRIEDETERERLRTSVQGILDELGMETGCIVRTAGAGQTADFRS